jgi:hypothetical protein
MERRGEPSKNLFASLIRNKWTIRIVDFVLVPALIFLALWLPPVNLGARLFHTDLPLATAEGAVVAGPNGATLEIPPGAVEKRLRVGMVASSASDLQQDADSPKAQAVANLPAQVLPYGSFYHFEMYGTPPTKAEVTLPVPADLATLETADLFAWDGQSWNWLPSEPVMEGAGLKAQLDPMPSVLMVAQSQPLTSRIGTDVTTETVDQAADLNLLTVAGLTANAEGGLEGEIPSVDAPEGAQALLQVSNVVDGTPRSDLTDGVIADEGLRKTHVANIVAQVDSSAYAGVEIAYAGTDPALRDDFTAFISDLAQALHAKNKLVAVRFDAPDVADGGVNTGAYDWRALGRVADVVRVPALVDPEAYQANGAMDRLFSWAVTQVDRRKIDLLVPSYAYDVTDDQVQPLTYKNALSLLAPEMKVDGDDPLLLPGESVTISMAEPGECEMQFSPDAQVYWFEYQDDDGQQHTVWLENASSVARKLQYVNRYALGGAAVEGALNPDSDRQIATVVQSFQENLTPPEPRFAFVWTVESATGDKLDEQVLPLTDSKMVWTAPNNPGDYIIRAGISDDGGDSVVNAISQVNVEVPTPTFTPTPTPTNTPTVAPTDTPTPAPTKTPQPEQTAGSEAAEASTPAPPPPPPASGGARAGFGYGIQADMISDGDHNRTLSHITDMGFNWVKQQVEWFRYNPAPGQYDWGALDRLVDSANAHGVNVLFSVVKAPGWARPAGDTDQGPPADPNTYGTFMRELAARYKGRVKAYEIWNEQNLYYEWGGLGNKINAARYVELLKVAYNAVKSVDPGAIVISGALTPTGVNDGNIAIDDRVYLEQMYQAGLARYCDAIGAHPSGYNNPPDADWRTWSDPSAGGCKGHPSWFFRGTMESYRNIMVKYGDSHKKIWPTEFGWATVENLGVAPAAGYEYAANNTEAEQAQFIVRAYQMGRNWGWVGPMFLWNLNFAPVAGNADEKAAFGIVRGDWSPRPAYSALRDMPK